MSCQPTSKCPPTSSWAGSSKAGTFGFRALRGGFAALLACAVIPTAPAQQSYPSPIVNTATAQPPVGTIDPNPANNTASDSNVLAALANLSLTKTLASASPAPAGSMVTYRIQVTNAGPAAALGATIQDAVPADLTSVGWTCEASGNSTCGSTTGSGNDISLRADVYPGDGNGILLTVNGTAPAGGTIGPNLAIVTPPPGTSDPDEGDNNDGTPGIPVLSRTIDAVEDFASTRQGNPVAIPVLVNDTLKGQPIEPGQVTVSLATPPPTGSVVLNPDGSFTYTPAPGEYGDVEFEYTICEVAYPSNCDTTVVTITIVPGEVIANDDRVESPAPGTVEIPWALNDTSTAMPLVLGGVSLITPPAHGDLECNSEGRCWYTPRPGFPGEDSFVYRVCDSSMPQPLCDTATVTIVMPGEPVQLRVSKRALQRTASVGDLVRYEITVENTGNIPAANAQVLDTLPPGFSYAEGSFTFEGDDAEVSLGSRDPLRLAGVDLAPGESLTLRILLRVGAGVGPGIHTNRVVAQDAGGNAVSNVASADVEVVGDPLLEESLIVGTVFNDLDGNGIQDHGERGIPGVRVVSVEGLLVETDAYGRYRLVGISAANEANGRNFILKVDVATLPDGSAFTTSNPLVRRITAGIPVRFDFGVRLPAGDLPADARRIGMEQVVFAFAPGSEALTGPYEAQLDAVAAQVRAYGGGYLSVKADGEGEALALRRARALHDALRTRLDPAVARKTQVEILPGGNDEMPLVKFGETITLEPILFATGKAELREEHMPLIHEIARSFERGEFSLLVIEGHADYRGSKPYNHDLGLRRAHRVFEAISQELSPAARTRLRLEVAGAQFRNQP